jgi:tetratricopeptide (TPR) repeat protein
MEMSLVVPDQFAGAPIFDIGGQVVGMVVTLGRGIKIGLPASVLQGITRSGKVTDFKSWTREDYFATMEGASFGGRTAAALDESMAARVYLEQAVKLTPSFLEGQQLLAAIYEKQRDYAAAVEAYKKVTELDGTKAEAYYGLGSVLMKMMKYPESIAAYEKAVSMNFGKKEIYFEIGSDYEELKEWAKAAEAYEKYLNLKPEVSWNAYLRLGFCRTQLQKHDAAIAAYLEAQKAQPKDLKVNFSLADAYRKAGQLEKAEEVYNLLAQINPSEAKSYYTQSLGMYNSAGKFDKAIGPAKKIVELDPKNDMDAYNLALMYFQLKSYNEAIEAFKQVLAIKPDTANAWFQIGGAYFNQKMYKEAVEAYKKFTAMAPDEQGGWLSLGVSYMYLKDYERALEPIKKAVEIKPDNASAQFNLAIIYINLKDNFSAKEIYKKLLTLDPALAEKLKKYIF